MKSIPVPNKRHVLLSGLLLLLICSGFYRSSHQRTDEDCCSGGGELINLVLNRCNRSRPARRSGTEKPVALLITCIDPRIDMHALTGDDFWRYDVIRVPGAVIPDVVLESARLAVEKHDVKMIMVIKHTDCAMNKVARGPEDARFQSLQQHCRDFDGEFHALAADPILRRRKVVLALAEYDVHADEDPDRTRLKILRRVNLR